MTATTRTSVEKDRFSEPKVHRRPASQRILLADDCPDTRAILSHVLESMGMEVTAVENGQDCIEWAANAEEAGTPFDLIFLDICMPNVDGNEAAKSIRQNGYLGPIIALTGYASLGGRAASLHHGFDEYVSKRAVDRQLIRHLLDRYTT